MAKRNFVRSVWRCPLCLEKLVYKGSKFKKKITQITCLGCNASFPLLFDRVPLLVNDPVNHLFESFITSSKKINELGKRIQDYEELLSSKTRRKDVVSRLISATKKHKTFVEEMTSILRPFIKREVLVGHVVASEDEGGKAKETRREYQDPTIYLQRDWGFSKSSEIEIEKMLKALRKCFDLKTKKKNLKALVYGAGGGRLIAELILCFDVFALDRSVPMVLGYHLVQKKDWSLPFVDHNTRKKPNNFVTDLTLRIPQKIKKLCMKRAHYCVGDALASPVEDHSMDCIFSVYFTDIVPIQSLIHEVKRTLKSGGTFIHYGPLFYHFKTFENKLSAEEIIKIFVGNGFDVVENSWNETTHLRISKESRSNLYSNWLFVAKLRSDENLNFKINNESVLFIANAIELDLRMEVFDSKEKIKSVTVRTQSGRTFVLPTIVYEFLKYLDGEKSFHVCLKSFKNKFNLNDIDAEIKRALVSLVKSNVVAIK